MSTNGFSDSDTKACSTWLSIGSLSMPASFMTWPVLPATATATFLARISPRVVVTPVMRSPSRRKPVTSQFSRMSTPRRSAPRA